LADLLLMLMTTMIMARPYDHGVAYWNEIKTDQVLTANALSLWLI
jgi:hypothetical protein